MSQTTVSSKYQVVIPKEIRERVHLRPGQKLAVIVRGNVISLVPDIPLEDLRGFLKGMKTEGLREKVDRL
jgi:AbrB family looped-hinge helix DNA binding protein